MAIVERIVNTAEHELGHAIGLDHTNAVSVMQPAGSFYTIQPDDVQAVQNYILIINKMARLKEVNFSQPRYSI